MTRQSYRLHHFKRTIYMYLEQRAEEDALFAKKYRNPAKNMDECVTHILNY
ncbi:Cas9 inhibitor AcrIIA9 family protein, partial [uncultured Bacteroides sp.]|uniref:Cas9 inhibitor AcrIIA9 family protein n=1 Tax=uncultured Bacteroides sp. TaxID=162156 RepID=UPI0025B170AB